MFKKIILSLSLIILLTGCTNTDLSMIIDNKKDVYFSHTILMDEENFEDTKSNIMLNSDSFSRNGFDINSISENNKKGYKIYKKIGNIKDLSKNNNEEVDLTGYSNSSFNNRILFKKKRGIIVDRYEAKLIVDFTDPDKAMDKFNILNQYGFNNQSNNVMMIASKSDIDLYTRNIDCTFTLNSSYKVSNHNANKQENGKLIWNLEFGKVNEINYTLYILNKDNVIITGIILFVLIIGSSVIIIKMNNNRKYNKVSLKDSLDLEYKTNKKVDIKEKEYNKELESLKHKESDNAKNINKRIGNNF